MPTNSLRHLPQALILLFLLAGCGGGGSGPNHEFRNAVYKSERNVQLDFLTFSGSSTESQRSITSDELFNWAEGTFPQFFPTQQTTKSFESFSYRFYPETNVYLATDNLRQVWVLGPTLTNGVLTKIGLVDDFEDTVVQVSSTYSIPVDMQKVVYPESYRSVTISANDQVNDPCLLTRSVIAVPRNWLDSRPLPDIKGAPLNRSIVRGAEIKDIGNSDNPAFVLEGAPNAPNGCRGDQKIEITRTLERLKGLGVQLVYMPYWHWVSKDLNGNWYYTEADETYGVLSDENLLHTGEEAKRLGIQLAMFNQVQGMKDDFAYLGYSGFDRYSGQAYLPDRTIENLTKFLQAHTAYMQDKAELFEALGVTYWELGCDICVFPEYISLTEEEANLYLEFYKDLAVALRSKYKGKLILYKSFVESVPQLSDYVDVIAVPWSSDRIKENLLVDRALSESALTAEDFESAFHEGLESEIEAVSSYKKEILIAFSGGQSRQNMLSFAGYVEETGCTAFIGDLNATATISTDCLQLKMQPDFTIQAIAYEGFFRALSRQTFSTPASLLIGNFWQTDNLIPQTAFPNIASSIRNKPAEAIVRAWFRQ